MLKRQMQHKLLIVLSGLLLASCGKSSDSKSKPTGKTANSSDASTTQTPKSKASAATPNTTPPSFVTKAVSNQSRLSLDIDFENDAQDKVTKANYKAELSTLEQSIGQQAARAE